MIVILLGMGLYLSTTKSELFGVEGSVGLGNYTHLLSGPIFRRA